MCEAVHCTNMDSLNEVLVEEPVSECRDMAMSNASLPLLQLCLTISHWVINGTSKYIHEIASCARNCVKLEWWRTQTKVTINSQQQL